jgi:hypothetical protein
LRCIHTKSARQRNLSHAIEAALKRVVLINPLRPTSN